MFKFRALVGVTLGSGLLVASVVAPVQAAAPGNDRIGSATSMTLVSDAASAAFTTAQATKQSGEYLGSNSAFQNTVWFLWDPAANQRATISNCSPVPTDETRLFVYEVSATTSSEPTSAPTKGTSSTCTNGNSISIMASSSKYYYIQVVSQRTATGTVSIATEPLPSYMQVDKVTICHRTHATTNPYRLITVSTSSIVDANSAPNGHALHNTDRRRLETDGPAGVFRPTYAYPSNAKYWGDIIPPFQDRATGGIYEGLNWSWATPANSASGDISATNKVFNDAEFGTAVSTGGSTDGNAAVAFCTDVSKSRLSAKTFYDKERDSGVDKTEVLADLDEQAADEDASVLAALGGSFSSPTNTSPDFVRPVPPTANVNRQVNTTKSKTVKFTVNFNESVNGLTTGDFTTEGNAPGCSVNNVSAASGTSVEVTVTCSDKGTVRLKLGKNGANGSTDIGPELDALSTDTTIEDEDPTPTPTPSASSNSETKRGGPIYKGNKAPKQSLSGVVWADLNQNGVQDPGEPLLSEITCTCQLKYLTTAPFLAGFRGMGVGPRYATTTLTVKTNAQGQYLVKNAATGEWTTTCISPTGMTVTYDSTGSSDGVSTASIPDGGTGFTWVGMVGSSTISAPLTDPSGDPADGEVVLTWEGPDGKPGTKDDVNFVTEAVNGEVNLSGLPSGTYRIRSINGVSVSGSLTVGSNATFQKALFTKKSSSAKLAATGMSASLTSQLMLLAGMSLFCGGVISLRNRRKLV